MINLSRQRWLIVALVHCLILFLVNQLNYHLAPAGIHVIVYGMLISFSALELSYRHGLLSLVPVAFLVDSKAPLPFGFSFALFACLFTAAYAARSRMRREISASALVNSLLFNLLAFCGYTFGAAYHFGAAGMRFGDLAVDLFASALVVMLLNKLFFELQTSFLLLFGINLAEEQRKAR